MSGRYVIHLPVVAADLPAAQRLARVVGRWVTVLPMMDQGERTVSKEDKQFLRYRVSRRWALASGGGQQRRTSGGPARHAAHRGVRGRPER